MIQGGDPTGTGRGGESIFGRKFEVETLPITHSPAESRYIEGFKITRLIFNFAYRDIAFDRVRYLGIELTNMK